ncbi:MAG: phosphoenolpyruvate-utilizing N-terminal domain-containing protein [Propionibacteriaceae bacterium]|nr:phosphoenolpyruvate-utilizing N-terminal domain-containing protein [Propionibacteriaceae bacterium]
MRWWPARKKKTATLPAEPQPLTGPAWVLSDEVSAEGYVAGDPEVELARLVEAIRDVDAFLTGCGLQDPVYAEVFRTQNAILHDVTWMRAATRDITKGAPAPTATQAAFSDISGIFDAITNATLRERGTDVRSMGRLVRSSLVGAPLRRPEPSVPSVWIVEELDAATAMQICTDTCLGVVATSDLVSGHGIEIATSRGFTCLTGHEAAAEVSNGAEVSFP